MDQSLDRISGKEKDNGTELRRKALRVVEGIGLLAMVLLLCLSPQVSCASRARHVLTQNSEEPEPEPEDKGNRNSYPVYLMEQQNLNLNQIPSPP